MLAPVRHGLVTLTTDFGEGSPYVAAMKGVILSINPGAELVDLSHRIPPQNVSYAASFLAAAIPYFPPSALHVIVVDPGVGTERALLYVEVGGHRLLAPDNGCWSELARVAAGPLRVLRLVPSRYWRQPVSATFHGRDILAPVAAHLSLGLDPDKLGTPAADWIRLQTPMPTVAPEGLVGEVIFVDDFGNLITNLSGDALARLTPPLHFRVGATEITRQVRCYADANPGTPVALVSSGGTLEIAVTNGSAAQQLRAGVGTRVIAAPLKR